MYIKYNSPTQTPFIHNSLKKEKKNDKILKKDNKEESNLNG